MNDIFISQMGHVLNFWFLLFLDCSLFISGGFSEMCIFSQQQMIVSNPNDPYEWWRLVSDTPVSLSILYIFISVSCLRRDIRKDPWNKYFIEWSLMKQIKSIICDNIICKSMQIIVFLSFKFYMTYSEQNPLQKSTRYHQKTIESRSQEIEHKQNLV